jgi:tripartite-type tricarboxylate transporter receptor subunit TctC
MRRRQSAISSDAASPSMKGSIVRSSSVRGHAVCIIGASAAVFPIVVCAQQTATPAYPTKAVRVVVPFPPGSGVDLVTRIVMPRVAESTAQTFLVDNRGGAGGIVGTESAVRAPADGYTLYMGGTSLVVTPLTTKVSYSYRDFAPIARLASVPFILVVHPTMPVKSLRELVNLARGKPGVINYASTGNWTTPHLTAELFRQQAKVDITHVPYKGSGPALTDLLGGHVDMFFCNMLSATPHVAGGKLRALAVTSLARSPVAAQVPTMSESGYSNFEMVTWFGLMAPAGAPEQVVTKLYAETAKALRRPDVQKELASQGASATLDQGPEDMANYIKLQTQRYGTLLKALGVKAQ